MAAAHSFLREENNFIRFVFQNEGFAHRVTTTSSCGRGLARVCSPAVGRTGEGGGSSSHRPSMGRYSSSSWPQWSLTGRSSAPSWRVWLRPTPSVTSAKVWRGGRWEGRRWEGRRVGGSQSFISVFSRCSLDIICETVMGQDAGAQDDSSTPYVQARSIF